MSRAEPFGTRSDFIYAMFKTKALGWIFIGIPMIAGVSANSLAASDLKLAPNLSFNDDSSPNFPILGSGMGDGLKPGEATVIFFGASNCWNTAREAERLVKVYPLYRGHIHFVVVDLNNLSSEQKPLVARYYRGAIPTIAVIDAAGKVIYDRAGETAGNRGDNTNLQRLLDSAR